MSKRADIDTILNLLDEKTVDDRIFAPHNQARAMYSLNNITDYDYNQFIGKVTDYYKFHYQKVHSKTLPSNEMVFGAISDILKRHYGSIANAQRKCQRASEGGMMGILNRICDDLIKEHEKKYIDYIIDTYIDPNDYDYITELMKQFMEKYRHSLPEEMSNRKLSHIVHNYRKYLEAHLRIVGQMKKGFGDIG